MDTDIYYEIPANYKEFLTPLGEMDFEALLAAAKDVEKLMEQPGWAFVQELVDRLERRNIDRLVRESTSTRPPDAAAYAATAGMVRGMRVARDAAQTVLLVAADRDKEEKDAAESSREPQEQTHG